MRVLIDGGATHCLRQMVTTDKNYVKEVKVHLAKGDMQLLQHRETGTSLSETAVQPIIPVALLVQGGSYIQWDNDECVVVHPRYGKLEIIMEQGCPTVDWQLGMDIIREIEDQQKADRRGALRALQSDEVDNVDVEDSGDLQNLAKIFPKVPRRIIERVPGVQTVDETALPFNRHARRRIRKAKRLVLHLFVGKEVKPWVELQNQDTAVIAVDVLHGHNLLDSNLYGWLLQLARSGKIKVLLAGPPCRTVSPCRHRDDNGPRPLRSRDGEGRFGLESLSEAEMRLVDGDSVLYMRTLVLMNEAYEANMRVLELLEQPEDPSKYREDDKAKEIPSFMAWEETQTIQNKVGLKRVSIEQGALGHPTRKPTALLTNIPEVLKIDGLTSPNPGRVWPDSLDARIEMSQKLASWAPGLKDILYKVIQRVKMEEPSLKVLSTTEKEMVEMWHRHVAAGHHPYRKDCVVCAETRGRNRMHKRVNHPETACLSFDMAGPFMEGVDFNKRMMRYFMVGTVTIPYCKGKPLVEGLQELADVAGGGHPGEDHLQELQELHRQTDAEDKDAADDVFELKKEDDAEAPQQEEKIDEVYVKAGEDQYRQCMAKIQELQDFEHRQLTMAVPVASRKTKVVLEAVAEIYGKVRAMGVPVLRIHTDRATEFQTPSFKKWVTDRSLTHTITAGDSPQENSRAEGAIARLRGLVRAQLKSSKTEKMYWPLALRHSSELMIRQQLRDVGIPAPGLLPFGLQALAKRKRWQGAETKWLSPLTKCVVMGPAPEMSMSSGGYIVKLEDGTIMRTTSLRTRPQAGYLGGGIPQEQAAVSYEAEGQQPEENSHEDEKANPGEKDKEVQDDKDADDGVPVVDQGELVNEEKVELVVVPVDGADPVPPPHDPPMGRHHGKQAPKIAMCSVVECQQCGLRQPPILKKVCAFCEAPMSRLVAVQPEVSGWGESDKINEKDRQEARQDGLHGGGQHGGLHHGDCQQDHPGLHQGQVHQDQSQEQRHQRDRQEVKEQILKIHWMLHQQKALEQLIAQEINCLDANTIPKIHKMQSEVEEIRSELEHEEKTLQDRYEQCLQTRTVSLQEVKKDIEQWMTPMLNEYNSLIDSKAIRPISDTELEELVESKGGWENVKVEKVPCKLVTVYKGGTGARKARICACGNLASLPPEGDVAAGGLDAIAIRTMIHTAAIRKYAMTSVDVKTAFLQAKRRQPENVLTLATPPAIYNGMIEDKLWLVQGALYGFVESPKDWGVHRDSTLKEAKWEHEGKQLRFKPTPERNLWTVVHGGETKGYLGIYVDDVIIVAEPGLEKVAVEKIRSLWKCSEPDEPTPDKAMRFCGYEVRGDPENGYRITQESFILDIAKKHNLDRGQNYPMPKVVDGKDEKDITAADLKAAQGICGELQWVAGRTRPDVCYATSLVSRLIHRRPRYAAEVGKGILKYLYHTYDYELHYKAAESNFGPQECLRWQRGINAIDVFVDASFALNHEQQRSVQGIVVQHAGNTLQWMSSRQPFITSSTAECELVGYCEAHLAGEATSALLEMFHFKVGKRLYGDSKSGLSLLNQETGSWRTRHLRLRAAKLREELQEERWKSAHMDGCHLVADVLTKPLTGDVFNKHRVELGLHPNYEKKENEENNARWLKVMWGLGAAGGLCCMASSERIRRLGYTLVVLAVIIKKIWHVLRGELEEAAEPVSNFINGEIEALHRGEDLHGNGDALHRGGGLHGDGNVLHHGEGLHEDGEALHQGEVDSSGSEDDEEDQWWNQPPRNENERKKWDREGWWWNGQTWCTSIKSQRETTSSGRPSTSSRKSSRSSGTPSLRALMSRTMPDSTLDEVPWARRQFSEIPTGAHDRWMMEPQGGWCKSMARRGHVLSIHCTRARLMTPGIWRTGESQCCSESRNELFTRTLGRNQWQTGHSRESGEATRSSGSRKGPENSQGRSRQHHRPMQLWAVTLDQWTQIGSGKP